MQQKNKQKAAINIYSITEETKCFKILPRNYEQGKARKHL